MTKQQMSNLFSWLPSNSQPRPNSGHSMLFRIEGFIMAVEVCDTLAEFDVRFTCEQAEDSSYDIEAQTED